jgi:hypothetical protein
VTDAPSDAPGSNPRARGWIVCSERDGGRVHPTDPARGTGFYAPLGAGPDDGCVPRGERSGELEDDEVAFLHERLRALGITPRIGTKGEPRDVALRQRAAWYGPTRGARAVSLDALRRRDRGQDEDGRDAHRPSEALACPPKTYVVGRGARPEVHAWSEPPADGAAPRDTGEMLAALDLVRDLDRGAEIDLGDLVRALRRAAAASGILLLVCDASGQPTADDYDPIEPRWRWLRAMAADDYGDRPDDRLEIREGWLRAIVRARRESHAREHEERARDQTRRESRSEPMTAAELARDRARMRSMARKRRDARALAILSMLTGVPVGTAGTLAQAARERAKRRT